MYKIKNETRFKRVWGGHEQFHMRPKPGTLIIFPGYLEHEYAVDHGIEPLDLFIGILQLFRRRWLKMSFKKNKYTVIRQAISKDLASFIANYFCMQKQVYDTCRERKYFSPFENNWIL